MSSADQIVSEEVLDEQHFVVEFAGLLAPNILSEQFEQLNFIVSNFIIQLTRPPTSGSERSRLSLIDRRTLES
jgi:hypothetical protein